jgi:hypothetical protein
MVFEGAGRVVTRSPALGGRAPAPKGSGLMAGGPANEPPTNWTVSPKA